MGDIVDLNSRRRSSEETPQSSYFVRVDLYKDGIAGAILDLGDDLTPELQRTVSDHLDTLSVWVRQQAHEEDPDDNDNLLSKVSVFASSRVHTWTSNDVQTAEQLAWLDKRFDDAKEAVRPPEAVKLADLPRHKRCETITEAMTDKGGYTKDTLAAWGVPWPPPKGWRQQLVETGVFADTPPPTDTGKDE